jgi:hypothetical protein
LIAARVLPALTAPAAGALAAGAAACSVLLQAASEATTTAARMNDLLSVIYSVPVVTCE